MTNEEALKTLDIAIAEVEWEYPMEYAIAFEVAQDALRERIERNNGWISVEDKLPDMCGYKVLLCATNKFNQTHVFTGFTGYMEHGTLDFHSCEPVYDDLSVWTITHWMPLPQPPKEDEP